MASAPTLPRVSVDDYLSTSWQPDMEYVNGVLIERSVPTIAHALLQIILGAYFRQFENQFGFKALPEVRTQIIEHARYRVPDLLLCPKPLPEGKLVTVIPLAVIEILSPGDKMAETLDRFRDYETLGVQTIIQMDPEKYIAHRFERGSLIQTVFESFSVSCSVIPFQSNELFRQLQAELKER